MAIPQEVGVSQWALLRLRERGLGVQVHPGAIIHSVMNPDEIIGMSVV